MTDVQWQVRLAHGEILEGGQRKIGWYELWATLDKAGILTLENVGVGINPDQRVQVPPEALPMLRKMLCGEGSARDSLDE